MLTIHEARQHDPTLDDLSDEELAEALDILSDLAEMALKSWVEEQAGSKVRGGILTEGVQKGTLAE